VAIAALVLALSPCLSSAAYADDVPAAREVYQRGVRYYDLGELEKALAAFKEAYLLYESPAFLFNIGLCERKLGHRTEAMAVFRTYLRLSPDASDRAQVEHTIAELEAEAARAVAPPPAPSPSRGSGRALRIASLTVGAVGVAGLATGIGLSAAAAGRAQDLARLAMQGATFVPSLDQDRLAFRAGGIATLTVGGIMTAVGAAVLIVGVVKGRRRTHEP
jgi:tetratricopeptide (TPR) repeat protein